MNKYVRPTLVALGVLSATWSLTAQTEPAPAPQKEKEIPVVMSDPAKADEDKTVVLSPFEVTSTKDNGYQATDTLAGTRIRTDLKDVGSAIQAVTKEFMNDVGATGNGTLLQYTTNTEVAGPFGTYAGVGNGTSVSETANLINPSGAQRVRGLAAADNTRDYFVTDIPWDSYNTDRVDIARGPNSFLFGLGSPAGIINASIHDAEHFNKGEAVAKFDEWGSVRGSIDVNQDLIAKTLAIRFDALYNDEKYQQKPAFQKDKRYFGALRWDPKLFADPSFHTTIKVKYENGDITADRPRTITPNDSITPWFRPVDATSLDGGMGKLSVVNGYTVGASPGTTSPWLAGDSIANQQQPIWFQNGNSTTPIRIYGGYVNTGAINPTTGLPQGPGVSLANQRYSSMFFGVGNLSSYATNSQLPGYVYGQYRNASLQDPSIFNFYDNLIDGPTKSEFEKWDAYNIDLIQTAFDDRLGVEFSYDRQKYKRGGQSLLSNPTISIDILQNFQDLTPNPNYGRPYVVGGPGYGSSYRSDREYYRTDLFGELRSTDFFQKGSLAAKILGHHVFNGVYSDENYYTENLSWQMYANSAAWASYKLQGAPDGLNNLPPVTVIYLGPSLAGATSASGANIGGITAPLTIPSGNLYSFASTWAPPAGVTYNQPWVVPANLVPIFGAGTLTQASNPANYVGWNNNFQMNPLAYNNGANPSLLTAASQSLRNTKSWAGTWQGFLWNDAIVPTLGWRYDEVESKGVTAPTQGSAARGALNLDPSVYSLPYAFPDNQIFKDHSTSGSLVVHFNKLFESDPIPYLNVSGFYNKSSNFQVTDVRKDVYGNPIPNPSGKTKDYGVLLSTKDGKYSLRITKYDTSITGANTQLDYSGIYNTIRDAMNWRNIKLYYMSGYAWSTAGQPQTANFAGTRYQWDPSWVDANGRPVASGSLASGPAGSTLETQAQADAHRDASIAAINAMQNFLAGNGYFNAWNYGVGPTTPGVLTTRANYAANPAAYMPNTASVYDYRTAPLLQNFQVTADTESTGYEFEFTANPTNNWRMGFNASETIATRTNVGGPVLDALVAYMDTAMAGPAGDLPRFNSDYVPSNQLRVDWNTWRGQYTLLKLQAGAATSELRKWRYTYTTNYTFSEGWTKGFSVGGSYRWQDKVVIGYPVIAGANGQASFDLSQPYYGPTEHSIDLWASYQRSIMKGKYGWKIQLNVQNAFAKDELVPISVQPDGHTWAAVRIAPGQQFSLTNTFTF
jgi:hypothetical protein